jgi:4-hydroxybenzoate polyprenyltransferase
VADRGNVATSRRGGSAYDRRMIETTLLNLVRRNWWLLALAGWAAWMIESVFAGNSASEIMTASLMVCIWVTAIVSIDRWIVRTADREEPRQ